MNRQSIEFEEAKKRVCNYPYALLYLISETILRKTEQLKEIDWSECQEARFFSQDGELHFFEYEEKMCAIEIKDTKDTGTEDIILKKYELDNRFTAIGKVLIVQEYLQYDEDGQAYVECTRLKDIQR